MRRYVSVPSAQLDGLPITAYRGDGSWRKALDDARRVQVELLIELGGLFSKASVSLSPRRGSLAGLQPSIPGSAPDVPPAARSRTSGLPEYRTRLPAAAAAARTAGAVTSRPRKSVPAKSRTSDVSTSGSPYSGSTKFPRSEVSAARAEGHTALAPPAQRTHRAAQGPEPAQAEGRGRADHGEHAHPPGDRPASRERWPAAGEYRGRATAVPRPAGLTAAAGPGVRTTVYRLTRKGGLIWPLDPTRHRPPGGCAPMPGGSSAACCSAGHRHRRGDRATHRRRGPGRAPRRCAVPAAAPGPACSPRLRAAVLTCQSC